MRRAMSAPLLMIGSALLFSIMGVCVKFASAQYTAGEIVLYRSLVGAVFLFGLARWRGGSLRTEVPAMHFWRSLTGVFSLVLWFYAIGKLPLATAITLNYMSSVWMALFLIGGAVMLGAAKVDPRLVATVLTGFIGVALVLQPTIDRDQWQGAMAGLLSGLGAAMAYLQVTALGRVGEPEYRVVFYFSIGGIVAGGLLTLAGGAHAHTWSGAALLVATGVLATVAQMMMTRAYAIGRALSNASLQYLGIVHAFIFGIMLFGDPLLPSAVTGAALIVLSGLYATRHNASASAARSVPR